MLVLDVLHQSVSGEGAHGHDRGAPAVRQASNGDIDHQQNGYIEARSPTVANSNPVAGILVRFSVSLCKAGNAFGE